MTEKVRTFEGSYDAKMSVAHAMGEVEKLWQDNLCGKSMQVVEADGYFRQIDMWLRIAQVHATAALVYATEEATQVTALAGEGATAPKKTCRCP